MLYKLLGLFFEQFDRIKSYLLNIFRKEITLEVLTEGNKSFRRYAVVCLYDRSPRPDIKILLKHLSDSGFGIIAAVSNDVYKKYDNQLDIIVRIPPIGRDFMAYQQGYRAMKKLNHFDEIESVCFFNDSVWFFQKYQLSTIKNMLTALKQNKLAVGTKIFDEVPHVSGWFFAAPINKNTSDELDNLFKPNFARKSRKFNIRSGEHKIFNTVTSVAGSESLDLPNKASPVPPHCYEAIIEGSECFYLKADSTIRTNPAEAKIEKFLAVNTTDDIEYFNALRWISSRADALISDPVRLAELSIYRHQHYPRDKTVIIKK